MAYKWEFGLVFYKFAENKEFLIGRFLPYKLGIETPVTEPVCGQENLCTHCVRSSTSFGKIYIYCLKHGKNAMDILLSVLTPLSPLFAATAKKCTICSYELWSLCISFNICLFLRLHQILARKENERETLTSTSIQQLTTKGRKRIEGMSMSQRWSSHKN